MYISNSCWNSKKQMSQQTKWQGAADASYKIISHKNKYNNLEDLNTLRFKKLWLNLENWSILKNSQT